MRKTERGATVLLREIAEGGGACAIGADEREALEGLYARLLDSERSAERWDWYGGAAVAHGKLVTMTAVLGVLGHAFEVVPAGAGSEGADGDGE